MIGADERIPNMAGSPLVILFISVRFSELPGCFDCAVIPFMETTLTEIVSSGLGAFLAWILSGCVGVLVRRSRLRSFLHVAFEAHFTETRENARWLRAELDKLTPGPRGSGAPRYTRNDLSDISGTRQSAIALLTKHEMRKVEKCFSALYELEALFEGFCLSLSKFQESSAPATAEEVAPLQLRARRILALVDILPNQFASIDDLPDDYRGRIGPETLVMQRNATKIAQSTASALPNNDPTDPKRLLSDDGSNPL